MPLFRICFESKPPKKMQTQHTPHPKTALRWVPHPVGHSPFYCALASVLRGVVAFAFAHKRHEMAYAAFIPRHEGARVHHCCLDCAVSRPPWPWRLAVSIANLVDIHPPVWMAVFGNLVFTWRANPCSMSRGGSSASSQSQCFFLSIRDWRY
jgi:hypothetical protein